MTADDGPGADPVDGVQITGDLWLAWVLPVTGPPWPWVLTAGLPPGREHCGCCCPQCAGHEQPGELPALFLARLRAATVTTDDNDPGGQP